MSKSFQLKKPIEGSSPTVFQDIPELPYLDKKIRFSLKDCDTGSYCIRRLENGEIRALYKRLGYFEQITWRDLRAMSREKGFSIEKKGDSNFSLLNSKFPNFSSYLHFRVSGTDSPFRVFGAMLNDLCYLLLIDPSGNINH